MVNEEEFIICQRRGHDASSELGLWGKCTLCGFWMREVAKLEERSDQPPAEELTPGVATRMLHSSTDALASVSTEEYTICKRRGHKTETGMLRARWDQCKFCGTWLREVTTQEVQADAPPDEEMGLRDRMLRMKADIKRIEPLDMAS